MMSTRRRSARVNAAQAAAAAATPAIAPEAEEGEEASANGKEKQANSSADPVPIDEIINKLTLNEIGTICRQLTRSRLPLIVPSKPGIIATVQLHPSSRQPVLVNQLAEEDFLACHQQRQQRTENQDRFRAILNSSVIYWDMYADSYNKIYDHLKDKEVLFLVAIFRSRPRESYLCYFFERMYNLERVRVLALFVNITIKSYQQTLVLGRPQLPALETLYLIDHFGAVEINWLDTSFGRGWYQVIEYTCPNLKRLYVTSPHAERLSALAKFRHLLPNVEVILERQPSREFFEIYIPMPDDENYRQFWAS